ncbi:MAG: type II secretion system protein J [marine bacterium B5-7]|nr:MAG: type II secretion system protein J [marine bacterium B5-7]
MKSTYYRSGSSRRHAGFTLIEVIASISVLAIMMALVSTSLVTGIKAGEAADKATGVNEELRVARRFLRRQITGMTFTPFDVNNKDRVVFRGDERSMTFVAPLSGYAGPGGPQVHRLEEQSVASGSVLRIHLSPPPAPDDLQNMMRHPGAERNSNLNDESSSTVVTLVDVLRDIKFSYYRFDAEDGQGQWLNRWDERDGMPDLVRIQITANDATPWPNLVVAPRARFQSRRKKL